MRNPFKQQRAQRAIIAVLMILGLAAFGPETNVLQAAPPVPPAPVKDTGRIQRPQPTPAITPSPNQPAASPEAPPTVSPDAQALASLNFHWERFIKNLRATKGTKLSAAQLQKPAVVIAKDLSGCPPSAENRLPKTIRAAAAFCKGEIKLVTDAFLALDDSDQLKAAASTFIYHALAKTTKAQRSIGYNRPRTDPEMLGVLQASLSCVMGDEEKVWVVMSDSLNGGDVFNAYRATIDWDGTWS